MDGCSVRRQNMSHVVIDLGRSGGGPATSASLGQHRKALGHRKRKVKSALIMAQQAKSYIPWHNTDKNHIKTMLQTLGDFPNLTVLTVDLSYWKLRVATLSVMVQATRSLKELTLRNLVLTGNLCDQTELESVLESYSNIQNLTLDRCRGTATVRTLLTRLSSLRKVQVVSSRISQSDVWASVTLVEMCGSNPKLRSLSLQDVLDLEDQHVCQLVEALRSKMAPALHELNLTSSKAGQMAGDTILSLLLNGNNTSLSKLKLSLGGIWNNMGTSVGRVLSSPTALRKLQLLIPSRSDTVTIAAQIAAALSCSVTRLTHLGLNVNLTASTGSGQYQDLIGAFESALKNNHTLEVLRFYDSKDSWASPGGNQSELTPFLRMKLDLNRTGLLRLLHDSNNQPIPMNAYLQAMTKANENLSVLFYALQNNPTLFSGHLRPCRPLDLHTQSRGKRSFQPPICQSHHVPVARTSEYFNASNISRMEALGAF